MATAKFKLTPDQIGALVFEVGNMGSAWYEGDALFVPDANMASSIRDILGRPDWENNLGTARLAREKITALQRVDAAAEEARHKYITPGSGQALTYQAKADELRQYDGDPNPVKADYPLLSAEIGITGSSLTAVADAVREALAAWKVAGGAIERTRIKAKADVENATTLEQVSKVLESIVWP